MMTPYSVLAATVWSSIFILVLYLCRRNTNFVVHFGAAPLLCLFGGCALRCFLPLDFPPFTRVISLQGWFAQANTFLDRPLPGFSFDLYAVLAAVWLGGTLLYLSRLVWTFFRSHAVFAKLRNTEDPQVLDVLERVSSQLNVRKVRVVRNNQVAVPMILFHLHPTVLLPALSYTDRELGYVLAHELTHWKNRDLWVKLLVQLCCALFWWNPLVYLLRKDLDQTLELKCDLAVTAGLQEEEKVEYLETILKTIRHAPERSAVPLVMASAELTDTSDAKRMKQRFHLILDYVPNRRKERFLSVFASLFVTAALLFSFAFVVQPSYDPPQEDITSSGSMELTPENTYLMKAPDGDYVLCIGGEPTGQRLSEELAQKMRKQGFTLKE